MLETLFNGLFGKSAVIWHYLVPREWLPKIIRS